MQILDKIMKKINIIIAIFSISVILISFYFVYSLSVSYAQKETIQSLDTTLQLTKNLLEEEEQRALSLSLLLSQDKAFLQTFYKHDRRASFKIIKHKIESIKTFQGYAFDVQVHDKNLHTYLRSWDFNITDVPLASFRKGLVEVKKQKRPLVSIEVGKRLNIKAISPIIKDGAFQGSIEVIENFEHLRKKLSKQGYALFILLDKKYLRIATTLQGHPLLDDKFIVVNDMYDKSSLSSLENEDLTHLGSYGYLIKDKVSYGYFEIQNFENEPLGYIVVALQNSMTMPTHAYHEIGSQNRQNNNADSEVIIR
ncbi:cache domain-containing protein [Sulfurimonas sp.]|uniref:cache domain-containing protein n=1 Tax=Sulfurimonas sp. TaxID=2022749 RepID=UPI0026208DBE|nr:cache domain-containing protein [Sulfurimonas sp.]